ncbi:hypothetical protein ACFLYN_01645 [Chloroflexota bacterium]
MDDEQRQYLVPFSELLDRLTVSQIKEILVPEQRASFTEEIQSLIHDINNISEEKAVKVSARYIRLIIILAQINLHIWHTKEVMMEDPDRSDECMKLAHQLNGIRNQVKNLLMEEAGSEGSTGKRTNINTDNLTGWNFSI